MERIRMHRSVTPLTIVAMILLGGCASWHASQADKAHARMAYAKAATGYDKALRDVDDPRKGPRLRAEMLRAADAHWHKHEMKEAAVLYGRAEQCGTLEAEQAFQYGQALMALGYRENAAIQFVNVLASVPEHQGAQDLLLSCEAYQQFYSDTTRYTVTELPFGDLVGAFSAVPWGDGVVIAGEQSAGLGRENPWNGRSFLDLYYMKKHTAASWEDPVPLAGDVNGPFHEGPATFSADGRTMYFTRSNYFKYRLQKDGGDVSHLKLFRATLDDEGRWGDLHEFAYNGEDFSTGHAALSADGRTLYFASDRPGGLGGSDLWRSVNNGAGWREPENLGPVINTAGDEVFPTVVGDALHFSSTAHQNMGGLDVFETHAQGDGWAEPRNMGYPINTPHDDFAFVMNSDGRTGYLSSDRGGPDRVHQIFVQQPLFTLEGLVFGDTIPPSLPQATVTLTDLATEKDSSMITSDDGRFRFRLQPNGRYHVQVRRDGMLTQSRDVSTVGMASGRVIKEDFHLRRIELDKAIVLNNIYFDYDMWDIRPDAVDELDRLVRLMNDNPHLSFEMSAHTDSRASEDYNLVLSDMRAMSTENYLIQHGVDPGRLSSRGYGETVLVNRCGDGVPCSEEEHQQNRRTEFKVIKVGEIATTR